MVVMKFLRRIQHLAVQDIAIQVGILHAIHVFFAVFFVLLFIRILRDGSICFFVRHYELKIVELST